MKTTVLDYVTWRGDLRFKQSKFNEIDNIIFSMLTYLDFERTFLEAKQTYPTLSIGIDTFFKQYDYKTYKFGLIVPPVIKDLAKAVQKTKRFGNVILLDYEKYINHEDRTQFCAVTYLLDDSSIVVAFQGTDDTLAGWYENFNMAIVNETIAQKKARKYLNRIGNTFQNKRIYVCGHSKGGNLAYYSSMFAKDEIKERIVKIYNNDGPGLLYDRYPEEKAKIIDEKGITIVPNSTIIGAIFEQRGEIEIISSKVKNLYQHDPFQLVVEGKSFIRLDKFTNSSLKIKKEIQKLLLSLTKEEIHYVITSVYEALYKQNKRTLLDLKKSDSNIFKSLVKIVKDDKKVIKQFIKILISNNVFIK